MDVGLIGRIIWIGIIAGIVGTAAMTLFLTVVTKSGYAHADMVRAVGSMFTRTLDNSFRAGLIIHYGWGIIFAIGYTIILAFFNVHNTLYAAFIGSVIGFIHGFAVSLLLVVTVAEHHPLEEFRNPGFEVAVAHFIAHLIYGFFVGLIAGMIGY